MSILWNFDKFAKIEELPFDPQCINANSLFQISDHELLLKAGAPLAVYEEDGGGIDYKSPAKKGALKKKAGPNYTAGTVHPFGYEVPSPTCFAAEDYHFILTNAQQPKLVKCVTKGYIEKAKVLEAMDAEEDPTADWKEDLAALGLHLVDDLGKICQCGGSGGGSGGASIDPGDLVEPIPAV